MTDAIEKKHADNLARISDLLADKATRAINPVHRQILKTNAAAVSEAADRIEALTAERDRLREAGSNAAKALRLIAGMDLMSASAVAFNAARELEAALKGESHE